jgi:hypothetical protein
MPLNILIEEKTYRDKKPIQRPLEFSQIGKHNSLQSSSLKQNHATIYYKVHHDISHTKIKP